MPETVRGLDFDTGELVAFRVEPALPSATQFKQISDAIQQQGHTGFSTWMENAVPLEEAQQLITDAVFAIDPRFAVGQLDSGLKIFSESPKLMELLLGTPHTILITTLNWDERNNWGYVPGTDPKQAIWYADGHTDYHRELAIRLQFEDEDHSSQLNYAMQRLESEQHENTHLHFSYHDSKQGENGQLELFDSNISPEQELHLLGVIQKIGDIALPH